MRGVHRFLAGEHAVDVAADGVDLAVVEDEAVRVRPVPARGRVGRKARVHQGQRGLVALVLQIVKEFPELPYQEHALVDDRPARERHDVGAGDGLLVFAAGDVESAVEVQSACDVLRAADKALLDGRHALCRERAQNLRMRRHFAPEEQLHALLFEDDLEELAAAAARERVLRQKQHADRVVARLAQLHALLPGHIGKEAVGDLQHDADAVAGVAGGVFAGPVLELFHDFQRAVDRRMVGPAADIDDRADPAGIVLRLSDVVLVHVNSPNYPFAGRNR
jgi:hypothetical protein